MNAVSHTEMPSGNPLRCERVTKRHAGQSVLRDVSLEIAAGTVLGLIGRNGAGKTTLIRSLLGLEQPDHGQAFVFGEPSLGLSDSAKQRVGYVPQQPDAFAWMRIGDMLEFVGRQYPEWDGDFVELSLAR